MTKILNNEQLQFYKDNGFLLIKQLISIPALDSYRQRFRDFCNGKVEKGLVSVVKDRNLYRKGAHPEEFINKIRELLNDEVYSTYSEDPRLLHIVAQLIGEDITAFNCMLINKPPGTNEHPPHQDSLYMPVRPLNKILATWTAIDPVTKENGCLYMIPGSHKPDILYEHDDGVNQGKQFFFGLVNSGELAPEHKRVDLEMDPGDTVFFTANLVHGSRPNISKTYRKAMTCHYAKSDANYVTVAGSHHEQLGKQMEAQIRRMGGDLSCIDIWRVKSKQVRGFRSNL